MRVLTARIKNYKCFRDTGEFSLGQGFNVIVGRNDSGKSALLDGLSLVAGHAGHLSPLTARTPSTPIDINWRVKITWRMEPAELTDIAAKLNGFHVPFGGAIERSAEDFLAAIAEPCTVTAEWTAVGLLTTASIDRLANVNPNLTVHLRNAGAPDTIKPHLPQEMQRSETFAHNVAGIFRSRIYAFQAERLNLGESTAAGNGQLRENAGNLAEVLNRLSTANPHRYERLMSHVRTIFPHITTITAPIVGGNTARILVWTVPANSEREDLAIPLASSGTGIGQVLAMLYVVVTSNDSTMILIDEPQSFLHPGAVRKLFEILSQYPQHQYIVTTHSPVVAMLVDDAAMVFVRRDATEQQSLVSHIDSKSADDMRMFLNDVGARLSDLFVADQVLWVEGRTEEVCFPLLLQGNGVVLGGTQILGVVSTDELMSSKNAGRIFDLYRRLTAQASLMPPAIAFVFDREGKSEKTRDDLARRSGGLLKWLPRRMYENYLLEAGAIAAVLSAEDLPGQCPVSGEQVTDWLKTHGHEQKYFTSSPVNVDSDAWYELVDGATLLRDLFNSLTDARVDYNKTRHGELLTRQLIAHPSDASRSLTDFLRGLLAK